MAGHAGKVMATLFVWLSLSAAGCGSAAEQEAARQAETRSAMAEGAATATRAAAMPSTGLWTEEQLFDRLLRSGVAPRRPETGSAAVPSWMGKEPIVILAGGGEVRAWIFPDSVARQAVTDRLDPETGTPDGATVPFPPPMRFIVQNNMAAFITGGTETNQERVALALQAGLPVTGQKP